MSATTRFSCARTGAISFVMRGSYRATGSSSTHRPSRGGEVRERIDRRSRPPAIVWRKGHDLEVQVRPAGIGIAGGADVRDHVSAGDPPAGRHRGVIAAQMSVVVDEAPSGVGGVDDTPAETIAP